MEGFRCDEQYLSCNYNYKREIEKELINSLPQKIITTAQAGKVIRTASSILRLNLLQCALLGWLLRHSNYSLRDLSSSASHISLFEEDQNKELLLLILLNAYYVKSFLIKEQGPQVDADVLSMMPQFAKIYKSWRPDSLLKDASLSEINLTFNKWTLPPKRAKPDYNQYVNKILQLSKTYNTTANEEEQLAPKKKRKHNEPNHSQRSPIKESQEEEEHEHEHEQEQVKNSMNKSKRSVWLRSQRMDERNNLHDDIFGYDQDPNPPADLLRRSTRLRSLGYMNFDLDNSRAQPGLNSIFAHSMVRTNSKGLFNDDKGSLLNPHIRQTSSFDEMNQ